MVNVGDNVLHNILARLPGKPLLRFRCVSKHWNSLISDPYFMKSRSRRMIFFPFPRPPAVIDDNVPIEDEVHSLVRIRSPLEELLKECTQVLVSIIGTFNGIVLLALTDESFRCRFVLYNPLTCASKILMVLDLSNMYDCNMYPSMSNVYKWPRCVFGLGHGETKDDLKLVRIKGFIRRSYECDVFDLMSGSWSKTPQYLPRNFYLYGDVGMFLNGFLYWLTYAGSILALDVKEMVFSMISLPFPNEYWKLHMGSIGGCLCMIHSIGTTRFDVWLMKEERSWMKVHSFTFGLEGNCFKVFNPICVLENGKIVMTNSSLQLVIYDTSKDSYKTLNGVATLDDFKRINTISDFNEMYKIHELKDVRPIEYVESLVSPSDMCFI